MPAPERLPRAPGRPRACGFMLAGVLLLLGACPNTPPVLEPVPNQVLEIGESLDLATAASDPEGDPLTFFGERLPAGARVDAASGRVTWVPPPGQRPRDYFFSLGVRDGGDPSLADMQNVMLSVVEPGGRDDFGWLAATVRDAETGEILPARVRLQGSDGRHYGSRFGILHDSYFYTEGVFQAALPAGPAAVTLTIGTEYIPVEEAVEIAPGQTLELAFTLRRWVHMAERGWFSGDVHLHANYGLDFLTGTAPVDRLKNRPEDTRTMILGEDLRVANFLVSNSLGDRLFDVEDFLGRPGYPSDADRIFYWNQEFRSPVYGHLSLLGLKSLVYPSSTGFSSSANPYDYPLNADIADKVHAQGGMVIYAHPAYFEDDFTSLASAAAREIAVDIALEKGDAMEVLSYASSDEQSVRLWYRVLNCGYRIPAVAGTDAFLNWVQKPFTHGPPGGNRVYVKLDGPLAYDAWIAGLKAGRSFVTNHPVILLSVNGAGPGSEVVRVPTGPAEVAVQAEVRSHHPLSVLEIVRNGEVVHTEAAGADPKRILASVSVPLDRSSWIAARARGAGYQPALQAVAFAHSNPVFVTLEGNEIDSAEDRLFFVEQIDKLARVLELRDRFATPRDRARVFELLDQAREIHRLAAGRARR